jgi:hypothetical protein
MDNLIRLDNDQLCQWVAIAGWDRSQVARCVR